MLEPIKPLAGFSAAATGQPLSDTVVSFAAGCRSSVLPRSQHGYDIRLARTHFQQSVVNRLVCRMYAWRGYNIQPAATWPNDPHRLTLAVWQDSDVAATLTIGLDSPHGLLADGLYADELTRLRCHGRVVCEVTRLAAHPDYRSRDMLGALFQTALQCSKEFFAASDAVIEVNPRHARFYQQRFGFQQVGGQRQCQRVNAPAVLLHQTLDRLTVEGAGVDYLPCLPEEWTTPPLLAAAS